ncbi:MAG TPA: hypothetical protein VK184_05340 [Nostocaceae cyanobacterium]|nr:hypothetical protein [Nostocaceae cyanobacterium]
MISKSTHINSQLNLEQYPNYITTKIVSQTPGRLRLRVNHDHRQLAKIQRLIHILEGIPHVNQVRTNMNYGSIVINHHPNDDSLANIVETLKDLGIIFVGITQGNTEASSSVSSAFVNLNQQLLLASGGVVDLRFLFPLGLGFLSLRQLILKGWQLELIPWYVLAWYAFDSYLKLHETHPNPTNIE